MLRDGLNSLRHLRELEIGFNGISSADGRCAARIQDVLGNFVWPKLEYLGLDRIEADEKTLKSVLRRHRGTLSKLFLYEMPLVAGSWFPVFDEIRALPLLKNVKVYGGLTAWRQEEPGVGNPPESWYFYDWEGTKPLCHHLTAYLLNYERILDCPLAQHNMSWDDPYPEYQ